MSEKQKAVLHVGCSIQAPDKLHETFCGLDWREVRLDSNPAITPDILASVTDMSVVAGASYEAVYSSRSLELLYPMKYPWPLRSSNGCLSRTCLPSSSCQTYSRLRNIGCA